METESHSFGQRIQRLRRDAGLTVRQLADMVTRSPGYISRIEVRGEVPCPELVIELAAVFHVRPEEFVDLATHDVVVRTQERTRRRFDEALALYRKTK